MTLLSVASWHVAAERAADYAEALDRAGAAAADGRLWTRLFVDWADMSHRMLLAAWEAAEEDATRSAEADAELYRLESGPAAGPRGTSFLVARVTDVPPDKYDATLAWLEAVRQAMAQRGAVLRVYSSLNTPNRVLGLTESPNRPTGEELRRAVFTHLPPPVPINPNEGFTGVPIFAWDRSG